MSCRRQINPVRSTIRTVAVGGVLFVTIAITGCANFRSGPFLGVKVDDPPGLSPYNRSLTDNNPATPILPDASDDIYGPGATPSTPYGAARPGLTLPTPETERPSDDLETELGAPQDLTDGRPVLPSDDLGPEETIPRRSDAEELEAPEPRRTFPEDAPPATADPAREPITLTVSDSPEVRVSNVAKFQIVVSNPFANPVEDVIVEVRFDEGLSFPDLPDRALRQRLGTLGVSESRTIDLSLTAETLGRHCVDFTVTAEGRDPNQVQRCVDSTEESVRVELLGPQARNVGGRLECLLNVENVTGREVSGVRVAIKHDAALEPREASAGAVRGPGRLEWDLGLLRADESVQIQVEFACPLPSEQSCIAAEVTGRNLVPLKREVCAVIHPRPTLDVTIADSRDPLPMGETTTYLVTVTNRGLEPLSDIRLDVQVAPGLEIIPDDQGIASVSLNVEPGAGPRSASYPVAGPLAPDDSRVIQIDVRGTEVSSTGIRVTARELARDLEAIVDEPTLVTTPLLDFPSFKDLAGE